MLIPVLVLLLLGTFDGSIMGTNQLQAYGAVRHGARLAAQLGGYGTPGVINPKCYGTIAAASPGPPAVPPADSTVDNQIIQDVLSVAFERIDTFNGNKHITGLNYSDVTQIVIYRRLPPGSSGGPSPVPAPTNTDGVFVNGTDHANIYNITSGLSGGITTAVVTKAAYAKPYPLSERCQGPLGSEVEVGVQMTYTYHPQNHITDRLAPNITFVDYAVERLALCDSNCLP